MLNPFVVGVVICNESDDLLDETFAAIWSSSRVPDRVIVIDNGDVPRAPRFIDAHVVRPQRNVGCAGGWNLLHRLGVPLPTIILNADLAVAPDTFEKMLISPARVLLAFGFGCFRIDASIQKQVGEFDEGFWPVYFEDTDYRRRMKLAGVVPVEWSYDVETVVAPGRSRLVTGIVHGKHDDGSYQGWRGEKFAWFHDRLEENKRRYARKWGGGPGEESYVVPFDGKASLT